MAQSNLALIYEMYSDAAVLSGGSWQTGSLALDNLRMPYFAEVARSTNLSSNSTRFDVDLGAAYIIGGIVLGSTNATAAATARIRAYATSAYTGAPIYDSGTVLFPGTVLGSGLLEWEDNGYWDGQTREFTDNNKRSTLVHLPTFPPSAQYWRIEISDPFNRAGFIEIGRLLMGEKWTPKYNYTYEGNSLDFEDLSRMEENAGGVRFYDQGPIRRSFTCSFDYLPDTQTYTDIYRMATRNGRRGQVVVVPNPGDPDSFEAEAFIGTFGVLPSLRRNAFAAAATNLKIEEVL